MLIDLQNESKLHAWFLQGMTQRGKAHWKDCSLYYEEYKPTDLELHSKEDNIKFDQYTKAFAHTGPVPDAEGRLMNMVEQVIIFEQNCHCTMKGVSPACEFYENIRDSHGTGNSKREAIRCPPRENRINRVST